MKSMKSFFSKKSILGTMAVAAVCMLGTSNAQAQEFTIQGDLVSSYVWRGIYQGGAASFQPTLGFSVGNFSLTAWGSTSLSESNKEIDLTAAYKFGEAGPTLSVATLWWDGQADVANGEYTCLSSPLSLIFLSAPANIVYHAIDNGNFSMGSV